jgi:hypothetical protein
MTGYSAGAAETMEGCIVKAAMEAMPGLGVKTKKIGLSGPAFTLRTLNSACSTAFYARISGIRAYPLKYTDPDGREPILPIVIFVGKTAIGAGELQAYLIMENKDLRLL